MEKEKVKQIISDMLKINMSEITDNASFYNDLGADSLDAIELVMALEEEFGISIPDEDIKKIDVVSDVIKYIESKIEDNP